jgi:hypothetical protein
MTGSGDEPGATPGELRAAVTAAAARIHQIIDAAERAGSDIRRDAEAEAERYLSARRREADAMVADVHARLGRIRLEAQGLADALAQSSTPAPEPEPAPEPTVAIAESAPQERRDDAEELRVRAMLRATQMAVAGEGREAIDRVLREEFGIEQTAPILDGVLGR